MHLPIRPLIAALLALPLAAQGAVRSEAVEYQDGDTKLKGYLYYDDAISGKRPGVIVVHEWWGLNDYAKRRAEMLAGLGYAAFALDMYGDNKVTTHAKDAQGWSTQITQNKDAWRRRALAAEGRQQGESDQGSFFHKSFTVCSRHRLITRLCAG